MENDLIGYYPSIITSLKQRVFFIFIFSPHQHRENHRERFYDEFVCTLSTVQNTNKNLLIVKEVFLLKYERNCYLWSVKWKSIRRTFVGIVVSAKETKALFTR